MTKTIPTLLHAAEVGEIYWIEIAGNAQKLLDMRIPETEALRLAAYFKGKVDAYREVSLLPGKTLDELDPSDPVVRRAQDLHKRGVNAYLGRKKK